MANGLTGFSGWHSRPLCCTYVAVRFRSVDLQISASAAQPAARATADWAIAAHSHGGWEILGVWLRPESRVTDWRGIRDELRSRGVERFDSIDRSDIPSIDGQVFGDLEWPPTGAIRSLDRRQRSGSLETGRSRLDAASAAVAQALRRSFVKRGPFESLETATAFLRDALQRSELRVRDKPPARRSPGAVVAQLES